MNIGVLLQENKSTNQQVGIFQQAMARTQQLTWELLELRESRGMSLFWIGESPSGSTDMMLLNSEPTLETNLNHSNVPNVTNVSGFLLLLMWQEIHLTFHCSFNHSDSFFWVTKVKQHLQIAIIFLKPKGGIDQRHLHFLLTNFTPFHKITPFLFYPVVVHINLFIRISSDWCLTWWGCSCTVKIFVNKDTWMLIFTSSS